MGLGRREGAESEGDAWRGGVDDSICLKYGKWVRFGVLWPNGRSLLSNRLARRESWGRRSVESFAADCMSETGATNGG